MALLHELLAACQDNAGEDRLTGVPPRRRGGVRQPALLPSSGGELSRECRLVPARLSEPIQSWGERRS